MTGNWHDAWQVERLERPVTEQAGRRWREHGCALPGNPSGERGLDAMVSKELRPGVEQGLQGSRLVALTAAALRLPRSRSRGCRKRAAEGCEGFAGGDSAGDSSCRRDLGP